MTNPPLGGENEQPIEPTNKASLAALSLVTASFRSRDAEASILKAGDELFFSILEEKDTFGGLMDGNFCATRAVAAVLDLKNSSTAFESRIRAFMINQGAGLSGERGSLLLGGFLFNSELLPCGDGTYSGISLYKDGKVKIVHDPWAAADNTDEAHTKLFDAMQGITDGQEVMEAHGAPPDRLASTGWGRVEKFIEAWPAIFEAATNLP